jgi:desulfoferrodoxin (superoxide reductase-like protein)
MTTRAFALLVAMTASFLVVDAFAPTVTSTNGLHTILFQQKENVMEIDRRLAMVQAAAAAVAATSGLSSFPATAEAKSAIFSLEAKVTGIEKENLATKNSNGDPSKHTPQVTIEESTTMKGKAVKFIVPHVMDAEKPHYIQYMWLEDVSGKQKKPPGNIVAVKAFKPTDSSPPTIVENVASGRLPTLKAGIVKGMVLKPCLYCNLHGLWEGEPVPIV